MKKRLFLIAVCAVLLASALFMYAGAAGKDDNYSYIKDGKIDLLAYFELSGATAVLKEESIDFTMTEETATIQFKKPLAADGFNLQWNGVDDSQKLLETLALQLADSEDESISLLATFGRINDTKSSIRCNDDAIAKLIPLSTYRANKSEFNLVFDSAARVLTDDTNYTIHPATCENGQSFTGFPSSAINLTITMSGKVGATFSLKSINAQRFGTAFQVDRVEPMICMTSDLTKAYYNSVITIPAASAYDVLANEASLKLTVKTPEGETAKDTSGAKLEDVDGAKEYQLEISEYGQYRISYVASDGNNETRSLGYRIAVLDTGAPEISLDGELKESVTVGDTVVFPTIQAKDAAESECMTWINVTHPSGYITCEKTKFVPTEEGVYEIRFYASDEYGNIAKKCASIYAKEGK